MKRTIPTALTACCVCLLLAGCSKTKDGTEAEAPPTVSEANASSAAKPASSVAVAPDETAVAVDDSPMDKSGVPECDEYVAKVLSCVARDRFPAKQREAVRAGLRLQVGKWQTSGNTRSAGLGCKAALEAAKKQYASVGCEF